MSKKLTPEEKAIKEKEKLKVTTQGEVKNIVESKTDFGWFILQTYSGKEGSAKRSVQERLISNDREDGVGIVLMPEKVFSELKASGMKNVKKKLYPAYLFIYAKLSVDGGGNVTNRMDEGVYSSIKNAASIHSFVGQENDGLPKSINRLDVVTMISQLPISDEIEQTVEFVKGGRVTISEGPFKDFSAEIESIDHEKTQLIVNVGMFGKVTPVTVSFTDVYIGEEE